MRRGGLQVPSGRWVEGIMFVVQPLAGVVHYYGRGGAASYGGYLWIFCK